MAMARMGLNTDLVVAQAITLVDDENFASLSLSSVAQRLGVRVPSLYKHIEGIDDLRERITHVAKEELWGRVEDAARGRHGIEAFRAIAIAYRDYAIQHPGRFDAAGFGLRWEPSRRIANSLERVAGECGVPAERAPRVVQSLRASLRGLLSLQLETTPEVGGTAYASLLDLLEAGLVNFDAYTSRA
jgi:AcrR family transcriptional regulator